MESIAKAAFVHIAQRDAQEQSYDLHHRVKAGNAAKKTARALKHGLQLPDSAVHELVHGKINIGGRKAFGHHPASGVDLIVRDMPCRYGFSDDGDVPGLEHITAVVHHNKTDDARSPEPYEKHDAHALGPEQPAEPQTQCEEHQGGQNHGEAECQLQPVETHGLEIDFFCCHANHPCRESGVLFRRRARSGIRLLEWGGRLTAGKRGSCRPAAP